ncbi:MAG: hypothetical protein ACK5UQ_16220, partial [Planctomycetota bacterium]
MAASSCRASGRDAESRCYPRFRARFSSIELRRPGMTPLAQLTLLCLECLPRCHGDEALAAIARWADLLQAVENADAPPLGDDAVDAIGWYLLDVTDVGLDDLQMAFQQHLNRYRSPIMTTA